MKKRIKILLIGLITLICILLIIVTVYGIKFKFEISKMNPLETKEVVNNVYVIKDSFVNMFIIKSSDSYIAIDSGIKNKDILKELNTLNIDPQKIEAVFITHGHADHVGGLSVFENAKYYISKDEKIFSKFKFERLEDNSIINFSGLKIQSIYTPGHTAGSVCYIVNDNMLFIGDTLIIKNSKAAVFNKFLTLIQIHK